jgi:predicted nucleotidyltransferase
MTPKITLPKEWIRKFCQTHHILKLALFGSVLSDHFTEASDIDILVEFDSEHIPSLFDMVDMQERACKEFRKRNRSQNS